jgi:signal transduction histidine kinase
VRVDFEGPGPDRLPALAAEVELAVFRAVQEGLSNVARHAQAGQAVVRLEARDGGITLVVEDDGVGLAAEELARAPSGPGRSGLFGMRERITALGGQVSLEAAGSGGFRLAVTVPVERTEGLEDSRTQD